MDENCSCTLTDSEIERIKNDLPGDEELYYLAELFRIFGDPTRVKILYSLFDMELCVCDIATLCDISQSSASHHLRTLRANKLVKFRRNGKTIFYSLADDHVRSIMGQGMEHVEE
ncbi:MAG: metalloregulator ArsR/SmtB family transcription factor [Clostridia bacterium]|jgi:ArsR family transcriptional regulator|nr:metalloregulator ArsR/SmtB family transcription factor [Clostridia bacterium]MCI1999163.1 metalloregulator ArsR/SmtB family transcription factor [Clostridia bacterium]MCI2014884.1 metalloregulator ArsR/SmtB family transcription factor [Clostridia bacterium]